MKMFIRWSLCCVCLLGLVGCQATYWYQEGKTFEECHKTLDEGHAELAKRSDLNYIGSYELKFMADYMKERGYRITREKDLPLDVRRQQPQAGGIHPLQRGIAGTIAPKKQ